MPDDAKEADWRWCWQGLIAGTVATSELGKVAWSRWLNDGFGYWWVTTGGFSFFHNGERGQIIEALLSLTLALLVLDLGLDAVSQLCGSRAARLCHILSASSLALLSAADLALFVGAGGARVSLPLVLFALQESAYVFRMVRPWLHFVLAASALLALPGILLLMAVRTRGEFHREAQSEEKRKPRWRIPQTLKLALGGYCGWALWQIRGESEGVGADLLSQLASDLGQMLYGQLLPSETREALSLHSTSLPAEGGPPVFPPLLIFHWEAGADVLLDAANGNATPYLQRLLKRPDVFSGSAVTGVPVTLKTAWEVLCGTPASASADFREQGSALRRECLPRALRRCCNYCSVLAKTDQELPDLPRRVFGFEETIVAEDMDALLPKLHKLLLSWDAYNASVPVFVYFYGGDAHPPYYPHRVANWERGYTEDQLLDVFLALSRRTDTVLEQLKEIWPPPLRAEAGRAFGPEHGLAFLLGDHGEQLTGSDPPPHGNLVSSDVTRTMLALEARAFASQVRRPARRLVRPADVYATVAQLCSLRLQGDLFVGKSLLGEEGHEAINSFSFYRPGDLAAVHFQSADLICSAEFRRPSSGWALHQVDASAVGFGHGKALASQARIECEREALPWLRKALRQRQQIKELLTESNVHAAWLMASMKLAAAKAKSLTSWALRQLLRPFLPPPKAASPYVQANGEGNSSRLDPK